MWEPVSRSPFHQKEMKQKRQEITHEFRFFRVYKDGHMEKFHWLPKKTPPSDDVIISADPGISGRIFLPHLPDPTFKLPVLLYFHGGGFSFDSAFSQHYHRHVSALSAEVQAVVLSVEYRLAPEHPVPACYDDTWAALQWVAAHCDRTGPEAWLNDHADFIHVFLCGDSAGGNISHNLAVRARSDLARIRGISILGLVLVHPVFSGSEKDDRMWMFLCPSNTGRTDPRLDPSEEDLIGILCGRVLVCVAEKDDHNGGGRRYSEKLKGSWWRGMVELVESKGEDHCFHLWNPNCEKALDLVRIIALLRKVGVSIVIFISRGMFE